MADYLHGAYGRINAVGSRVAEESQGAIVYVGTAPVHTLALASGESYPVNVPVVVNNISEARKLLGYSDDWAKYTLCEAMRTHLESKGVGPLVMINVLDPSTHKSSTLVTVSKTPENGRITIPSAGEIILETIVVQTKGQDPETKTKGTDYSAAYNIDKETIVLQELTSGALGSNELDIKYYTVDHTAITTSTVIGSSDGLGQNTGLFAIKDVYQITGFIPSFLACPGYSSIPAVHSAMYANSKKINGHWDAYMFVDLPIVDGQTQITLDTARTYKSLSVLAAAIFQDLLIDQEGIPYRSASNTDCAVIENLYLGEGYTGRVYDDEIINEKLNKYGIASAAYVGGRWAIWGAHSADYSQEEGTQINVAETNRMMLFYVSNDFQARRVLDVDQPLTPNDIRTIVSEEQSRIDALLNIGALIYGTVEMNADAQARSDILNGDYSFVFNVTTTPLAKSLTAIVNWTDDGFVTYFTDSTASAD